MNTKEFIEKLSKDEELQQKFKGVTQPEKFYEVASVNGLTDDLETMKKEASKLLKEASENSEMDLESLQQVAGGDVVDDVLNTLLATAVGTTLFAL